MPRYLVERHFPEGLQIPLNETGRRYAVRSSPITPRRV